jgi:hypothetical protein
MSGVLSPRRRLYPPACRPYGLEAEPEAAGYPPSTYCRTPPRIQRDRRAKTLACPAIALF